MTEFEKNDEFGKPKGQFQGRVAETATEKLPTSMSSFDSPSNIQLASEKIDDDTCLQHVF